MAMNTITSDMTEQKTTGIKKIGEWRDYFALLKPRVMSLVVFTALVGLVAAEGKINPVLGAIAILAIALGAGAAGAFNMWYDSDIDGKMQRTKMRPIPAGIIDRDEAFNMGIIFSGISVMLLAISGGYIAAGLLAFTIFFYAVVYSMWLKRNTDQNIVIGGLAGALPPLVAWFAAGGTLSLNAILPVLIILFWTPPHSWALALYKAADYSKANIPMLPITRGPKTAKLHILLYSIVFVAIAIMPSFTQLGGVVYFAISSLGGALFLLLAIRLFTSHAGESDGLVEGRSLYSFKHSENKAARDLFAFSLIYLTILFMGILLEHGFGLYRPFMTIYAGY